jgi:hypothetical protein
MKFMVMCALDPVPGRDPDARVAAGLAGIGLLPVGSSRPEEGCHWVEQGFVGEFRGQQAASLEAMLRVQISGMLCGLGSGIRFRLCLVPMSVAAPVRKQA